MPRKTSSSTVTSRAATERFPVAVDVGRSSVKIATESGNLSFPFLLARKKAATADYYIPGSGVQKWANVDGEEYLFGEEALRLGDTILQYSEGPEFTKAAVAATVFSIALAMLEFDDFKDKVDLAINLTFDNHYLKSEYAEALKKEHTVEFVKEGETITFSIEHVFVLYQGFSGLLSFAMDDGFKVRDEYLHSEGVIIDVGRQTIDFLYVDGFVVKAGSSKDFGTFKVYEKVVDLLKRKHKISKEPYEIEDHLSNNKPITTTNGNKIQLAPLVKEAVAYYFDDVATQFSIFLSKKTPDYLTLLGGGALVYGPFFKERYPLVEVPEDPQFANAVGMLRFVKSATVKK